MDIKTSEITPQGVLYGHVILENSLLAYILWKYSPKHDPGAEAEGFIVGHL